MPPPNPSGGCPTAGDVAGDLCYLVQSFATRTQSGTCSGNTHASMSVIEVNHGKGHVAFTDDTLHVSFPRMSPEEGLPNLGDFPVYHGMLDGLATEIAKRFAPHANDPDAEYEGYNHPKEQ